MIRQLLFYRENATNFWNRLIFKKVIKQYSMQQNIRRELRLRGHPDLLVYANIPGVYLNSDPLNLHCTVK